MLYVSTRDERDAFTAYRVLREGRSADGGYYVPFRGLRFSEEELNEILEGSFSQCVAGILNRLFGKKLTAWDLEMAIGRSPARMNRLGQRVILVETWYNPDWRFERLVKNVYTLLTDQEDGEPGSWVKIAVRAAVLFGVFAEIKRGGGEFPMDIAMVSGDFSGPMSAWYAKSWGLPIGNIVCCCNENNGIWELLRVGQLRTDSLSIPTAIPEADVAVPEELERLIFAWGGAGEVRRYLEDRRVGRTYLISEELRERLGRCVYVSVVSSQRVMETIPSVYRTHGTILTPAAALAYAGALDYRAKKGGGRCCLVLSENRADQES